MKNKKIMLVLTSVVFFVSCSKQGEKNLKSETSTPSSMSESIDLGKVSSAMTSAENGRANWTSDYDGDCYWIQGQNMDGGDVISSQNHFELNYYYKTDFLSAKFKIPKGAFFQQKETREDLIYDFQVDFSEKKW